MNDAEIYIRFVHFLSQKKEDCEMKMLTEGSSNLYSKKIISFYIYYSWIKKETHVVSL